MSAPSPSKQNSSRKPYLSVVAASRNDDHGGDPLLRTQIFINTLARQCEKHRLPAELIIVDWNPVKGRPGLAAVLGLPEEAKYLRARVITVPTFLHNRLKYADRLPFFQMIAKNVGIRRSQGQFILATNIDIIFSDELVAFIAKKKLDPKKQYRVDRYDIKGGLSQDVALDEALAYAWANPIRSNRRYCPERLLTQLYGGELFKRVCVPSPEFRKPTENVATVEEEGVWQIRPHRSAPMSHLHTNACGDFTLMSREGWEAIRGYPEFEAFSFNIDSMGMLAAHYGGYEEVALLPPCVCFHIEHGVGSGWTPEGEKKLFDRLNQAGILNPEWPVLTPLVDEMREKAAPLEFNHSIWGMANFDLPSQAFGDSNPISESRLEQLEQVAITSTVGAIQPAYDLDRVTLLHERRLAAQQRDVLGKYLGASQLQPLISGRKSGLSFIKKLKTIFRALQAASAKHKQEVVSSTLHSVNKPERVTLYIPNEKGRYSEENSLSYTVSLDQMTSLAFRIESFNHRFPLRFDPCESKGLIEIKSLALCDERNGDLLWKLDQRNGKEVRISGTAVMDKKSRRLGDGVTPFRITSAGLDPQLILPRLPRVDGFPLVLTVDLQLIACNG